MPIDGELVKKWKEEYGEVFSVEADDLLFVFRKLTFKDLDTIMAVYGGKDNTDLEDGLVSRAVLWPPDITDIIDNIKPGVIDRLATEIRDASNLDGGVKATRDSLDRSRSKMSGFRGEMCSFVMFALPQYKLSDLIDITFDDLSDLVAIAEKVLDLKHTTEGFDGPPMRLNVYSEEEIEEMGKQKIADGGNATVVDPIAQKLHGKV